MAKQGIHILHLTGKSNGTGRPGWGGFSGFKVEGVDRLDRRDWDGALLTRSENTAQDMTCLLEDGLAPARIVTL